MFMTVPVLRRAMIAGLLLGLSACAGTYVGADKGLSHIGAVKRGDNLYDVVYLDRDGASPEQRRDLTLLQSAELCQARGYDYFRASDTAARSTFTTLPDQDTPGLTLQVSCYASGDATAVTYSTREVIDRISARYHIVSPI